MGASTSTHQPQQFRISTASDDSRRTVSTECSVSEDTMEHRNFMHEKYELRNVAPEYLSLNGRLIMYIITVFIILWLLGMTWGFIEIRSLRNRMSLRELQSEVAPIQSLPPAAFIGIAMRGVGQIQKGKKGIPIRDWEVRFRRGRIDFIEGKKILIEKSGVYHVFAQLFFYRNRDISKRNFTINPAMDFGIRRVRSRERLTGCTVSINSCQVACTRRVSGLFHLDKYDMLVVDTETEGVYFKMLRDKSLFGAYLINEDTS